MLTIDDDSDEPTDLQYDDEIANPFYGMFWDHVFWGVPRPFHVIWPFEPEVPDVKPPRDIEFESSSKSAH